MSGFYRAWGKRHVSPYQRWLYRRGHYVWCRHWRSSLLHLHYSMYVRGFTGWCPALHWARHGGWAGHLWNVVLHTLRGLIVGLYWSGHRLARPCWTVRGLSRPHLTTPLTIMIHTLFWWHHLLWTVHARVARSLGWAPRATLSTGEVLIVHVSWSLPHAPLRTLWLHHLRGHGGLRVGTWTSLHPITTKGVGELIAWTRRAAIRARIGSAAAVLIVGLLLSWRGCWGAYLLWLLLRWLLSTRERPTVLTLMTFWWRISTFSMALITLHIKKGVDKCEI